MSHLWGGTGNSIRAHAAESQNSADNHDIVHTEAPSRIIPLMIRRVLPRFPLVVAAFFVFLAVAFPIALFGLLAWLAYSLWFLVD